MANNIFDDNEFSLFDDEEDQSFFNRRILENPNTNSQTGNQNNNKDFENPLNNSNENSRENAQSSDQNNFKRTFSNNNGNSETANQGANNNNSQTTESKRLEELLKAEGIVKKPNENGKSETNKEGQANNSSPEEKDGTKNDNQKSDGATEKKNTRNIYVTEGVEDIDEDTKVYPSSSSQASSSNEENKGNSNSGNNNDESQNNNSTSSQNDPIKEILTQQYNEKSKENQSNNNANGDNYSHNNSSGSSNNNGGNDSNSNNNQSNDNNSSGNNNQNNNKNSNVKKHKGVKVFGLVFVIILIVICGGIFLDQTVFKSDMFDKTNSLFQKEDYIAKLSIKSEITDKAASLFDTPFDTSYYVKTIKELKNDNQNKALILFLDSPGGSAYNANQILAELKSYHSVKPIVTVMGSIAASGAYLLASESDYIVADASTLTGSIGVTLGTQFDLTEFLKKNGISSNTITSGKNKDMSNAFSKMTEEQKTILQDIVNDEYNRFLKQIEEGRDLPLKSFEKVADGRIMTAKIALDYGLIDKIGTENDAKTFIYDKTNFRSLSVVNMKEDKNSSILNFLFSKLSKSKKSDINLDSFEEIYKVITSKKNNLLLMLYEGN